MDVEDDEHTRPTMFWLVRERPMPFKTPGAHISAPMRFANPVVYCAPTSHLFILHKYCITVLKGNSAASRTSISLAFSTCHMRSRELLMSFRSDELSCVYIRLGNIDFHNSFPRQNVNSGVTNLRRHLKTRGGQVAKAKSQGGGPDTRSQVASATRQTCVYGMKQLQLDK